MIASSVVNLVCRQNPDWTPAQVLTVVQDVINMVLKRESDSQVYIDPSTGDLPFLSTTAGTYTYNITSPTGVWKIANILVSVTKSVPVDSLLGLNYDSKFQNIKLLAKEYTRCPVKCTEQLGNQPPSVTFEFDPGTQTALYQIQAYKSPVAALSLSSYIPLPDKLMYVLVACVQDIIDALDNGRFGDALMRVQSTWLPQLIFHTDKDEQMIYSENYSY